MNNQSKRNEQEELELFDQENKETDEIKDLPIEPDYYLIKNEPNAMWFKYEEKIRKVTNSLGYWKNFDSDDLYQQSYMYFVEFCKNYDPYYNGNFIPFDKYLFKNLIIKLRAYIQSYYFRHKREQPTEFSEYLLGASRETLNVEDKLFIEYIYNQISDRQSQIIKLSMDGYKQQEIGELLDISQSRVSVIKKKTLKKLKEQLKNE